MIVKNEDAIKRLNSPMNLINRLRETSSDKRKSAMSLFIPPVKPEQKLIEDIKITFNPFQSTKPSQPLDPSIIPQAIPEQPTERLDNILENHESQIKLGLAHDKALDLLTRSVETLSLKLEDVRADKLPAVISAASKTVESIRKERLAAKQSGSEREVHYHFYTPEQKRISDYEVVDVSA